MGVPGMNLLNMAMTVIQPTIVTYKKYASRTINSIGNYITTYDTSVDIPGSLQAVPRSAYQAYGLDYNKTFYTFYTSTNVIDTQRDVSGDQMTSGGFLYQCVSENDWFAIDGWTGVLLERIGPVA